VSTATDGARPWDATVELPRIDAAIVSEQRPAPVADEKPPKAQATNRLYALDLMRFGAAMLVVAYHYIYAGGRQTWGADTAALFTSPLRTLASYGWMGVDLFFLISGFVICMTGWGRRLSDFFISRVIRLMPAYVVAVVLTAAVLTLWPPPAGSPRLPQVLGNLTMVQGLLQLNNVDEPYWTLLVELKFYLLFAIVVHAGVTYRRAVAFCLIWTTAAVFAYSADFRLLTALVEPKYASYFVAGIALYLIHRFGPTLLLWGIVAASFVFNTVSLDSRVANMAKAGVPMSWKATVLILAACYLLMIGVALGWFARLRSPVLVTLGALTYPLYLLHMANGQTLIRHLHAHVPHWVLLGMVVAIALLAAYLVNQFAERPLSRVLRRGLRASFEKMRQAESRT
jgi:peptidoglycan/LPS O-acetylase OafA/YrhL